MEKQIEEMARIMCDNCAKDLGGNCEWRGCGICENLISDATALYNAGYLKASDVAREIFEEIERTCVDTFGCFYIGATHGAFAELKKKYTEISKEITEEGK